MQRDRRADARQAFGLLNISNQTDFLVQTVGTAIRKKDVYTYHYNER
jgi:hypothetical protein